MAHPALIMYVPAHRFVLGEFVAGDDGELTLEQLEVTTPFVLRHTDAKFERQPARLQELHEETEKLPTKAGEHDPPVLQQLQRQQSPLVHVDGLAVPTELLELGDVDGHVVIAHPTSLTVPLDPTPAQLNVPTFNVWEPADTIPSDIAGPVPTDPPDVILPDDTDKKPDVGHTVPQKFFPMTGLLSS